MPFVGRVTNSVKCFLQQLSKQVAENFCFYRRLRGDYIRNNRGLRIEDR